MSSRDHVTPSQRNNFNIVVAYFTDIFFNHLYTRAEGDARRGSLTQRYQGLAQDFATAAQKHDQSYSTLIDKLHQYYAVNTNDLVSFKTFIDKIVGDLVPEEIFEDLRDSQKDVIFGRAITQLVGDIATYVTSREMLPLVIDMHDEKHQVSIGMIKNHGFRSLISTREELFNKFLQRSSDSRDMIPASAVEDYRKLLGRLKDRLKIEQQTVSDLSEQHERDRQELARCHAIIRALNDQRLSRSMPRGAPRSGTRPPPPRSTSRAAPRSTLRATRPRRGVPPVNNHGEISGSSDEEESSGEEDSSGEEESETTSESEAEEQKPAKRFSFAPSANLTGVSRASRVGRTARQGRAASQGRTASRGRTASQERTTARRLSTIDNFGDDESDSESDGESDDESDDESDGESDGESDDESGMRFGEYAD